MKVYIHKCDSMISKFLYLFHDYGDTPKFSHYAMSFVTDNGNRIFIDTAEHNVHLTHEKYFNKRWNIVGEDHVFEVDEKEFWIWFEPFIGRPYGYLNLIGHAFKKILQLKKNPLGDGAKSVVCNEIALLFVNRFFGTNFDTENYDLMETEKALLKLKN